MNNKAIEKVIQTAKNEVGYLETVNVYVGDTPP